MSTARTRRTPSTRRSCSRGWSSSATPSAPCQATTSTGSCGDRFENPSFDDLRGVLDAVLADHPAGGVRCTLAWVVAQGMPAAEAARDLLRSDDRLRLPDWVDASS